MGSFVAISLDDETKSAFAWLQRVLPVGRPVPQENMHLTIVFLDNQSKETLEALREGLLAISVPPFGVTFSGIDSFGQVIAVGLVDFPALVELHQKVQTATRQAGIILPRRRFRPHVTIARLKTEQRQALHNVRLPYTTSPLPEMFVAGFTLFQSTLRPDGARHDALAQYNLG